jgi:subfamily B ATP-binding cassette protein MsbA
MTFLFMLFSIMSPISSLNSLYARIQRGIVGSERVFAVMDTAPTVQEGTEQAPNLQNSIEINDLSFRYTDEVQILDNVSFSIPKSKTIALVGNSGSGKSTLADLLIRFYDPEHGGILLDGKDVRDFTFHSYRRLFGIVSQEATLFNDTITNNIRIGNADATDEEVQQAAKIANAHEFIAPMPQGYNTLIGDRGVLLSGGQRQRLAIARALVGKPEILIFDEATSSLDSESEKIVQNAIIEVLKNRTAIIIAHRLSTIVHADNIIVMDKGRIAEEGTHTELLQKNGIYKKLYEIQYNHNTNS